MYCCLECGHIFDENDIATWQEDRGEYWGVPCSESVSGCPQCGGDYVKTYRCGECGEWILGGYVKLESGKRICEDCYTTHELGDEE